MPSRRNQTQFEVLLRHLLYRFLHHELLSSDDETKRVLQTAYAVALPTLVVSLFLFPPYHAVPPLPHPRPLWSQVSDHYFFVMYSFVLMGIATVYEWDLLFPDLLDVYILSVLPIKATRLFAARVLAVLIFLSIVLLLTSSLGIVSFPFVADLPTPWRHFFAHAAAVIASGSFSAASFMALQGILLNLLGERLFRRLGPWLQGVSLMALVAVLLLTPTVTREIQGLLTASSPVVHWFPPFWFLGLYERILHGSRCPGLFPGLAWRGIAALGCAIALLIITYPLAYRRRVRQLIEGEVAATSQKRFDLVDALLHKSLLRHPAHRATFHLATQTVLRTQRHRVMLALYAGLTLAIALAEMLVLHVTGTHIQPSILPQGIRAAAPITVFLTVVALRGAIWVPVDRRGAWVFRSVVGRPRPKHLAGTRRWVSFWAAILGCGMTLALHPFAPPALRHSRFLVDQFVLCCGMAVILTDLYLYSKQSMPFTDVRISSITDFPLAILRNFVVFPTLIAIIVALEPHLERTWSHLCELVFILTLVHLAIARLNARFVEHLNADVLVADEDVFPLGLGLRDG